MRLRTSFLHHGYLVTVGSEVFWNYLNGWLVPDALSALPIDQMVAATLDPLDPSYDAIVDAVQLLRILRIGRLARKMVRLTPGGRSVRTLWHSARTKSRS